MLRGIMLMLVLQGLLLAPEVSCLAVSEDSKLVRQHHQGDNKVTMDARGHMLVSSAAQPDRGNPSAVAKFQEEYPFYHTTEQIRSEAKRLSKKCGGHLNFKTLKDSGTEIDVVTVRKKSATPANKVFILFGEHSRELISPESGLYFLRALCGDLSDLPQGSSLASAEQALEDSEFQMVLNGNPKSRQLVEEGDYCLRVNENKVDLNRNWDEDWQAEPATSIGDTNPGAKPFSEPETRIFKQLLDAYAPTTFLSVHSGTKGMYMPWAFDMKHNAETNAGPMREVLIALDKDHCQCPVGAAGKEVGYPCPGTSLDYAYANLSTPFAFAFEIYVNEAAVLGLKRRWDEKMKNGGGALLEQGHHLGHQHFRDFFGEYGSDFVGSSSLLARVSEATSDMCFNQFNPGTKDKFDKELKNWAESYVEMSGMIAKKLRSKEVIKTKVAQPVDQTDHTKTDSTQVF